MTEFKTMVGEAYLAYKPATVRKEKVKDSQSAVDFLRKIWHEDLEVIERFGILLMNQANNIVSWHWISQGGLAGTFVDVRIIAKSAIESLAPSVIAFHNHPSGNTIPSDADRKITEKIKAALDLIDVKLLDHLIVTLESYFSFMDEGILNN